MPLALTSVQPCEVPSAAGARQQVGTDPEQRASRGAEVGMAVAAVARRAVMKVVVVNCILMVGGGGW